MGGGGVEELSAVSGSVCYMHITQCICCILIRILYILTNVVLYF